MNFIITAPIKLGILKDDLDYHLVPTSMVIISPTAEWIAYAV